MNDRPLTLRRFRRLLLHPYKTAVHAFRRGLRRTPAIGTRLNRVWLERRYRDFHGEPLRLDPPNGFNEHIIHRALHDRDPELKRFCDKIAVRDVIRERLGEAFVVPLLGAWTDPRRIAWDALPERFVLKPNHASGPVALVYDKSACDRAALAKEARDWLSYDYFDYSREWGYRGIPRRVIAEELLVGPDGGGAPEATVMTFGGRAAAIRIFTGAKGSQEQRDNWFDCNGVRLPFHSLNYKLGDYVLDAAMAQRIAAAANEIASGTRFLRVDFYLTDAGLKVGELTPYHGAGLTPWSQPGCDRFFGRLWRDPSEIDRIPDIGAAILEA